MQSDTWVAAEGGRIFVRLWQPSRLTSAFPLVLLHDSLGCVDLWRDFPAKLADRLGRPVVAYDRLGFGRSTARHGLPDVDFIREEAEAGLPAILNALEITEFALFGHSVGGGMALLAAARSGDSCKGVICESAQAYIEERTLNGIRAAKAGFQAPEQFERLKRWHGDKAQWVLDAWTETWLSAEMSSFTLEADLPRVHCPVLAIHGDQDEYGSVRFPEFICAHVGGSAEMHILKGCGHVPHREREEEVMTLIARFAPFSAADDAGAELE